MKPDKYEKSEELLRRHPLKPDSDGTFHCPSYSRAGVVYRIDVSGHCSCGAMGRVACCHLLAVFRAIHPILQFRWAADFEWLRAAGELYKAEIEAMPKALQEECRSEYRAALARLSGRINRPVSKYVKSYSQGTHIIERRQEPLRLNGVEV
jgi:hypothetical protein